MYRPRDDKNQQGFTIIELMIATLVVSTVMVMATVIITGIGKLYYKDISQSRVQDDVRSISDELAQHLQLTDKNTVSTRQDSGSTSSYCIDTTRYTFVIGTELGSDAGQSDHVLWRDTIPTAVCKPPTSGSLNDPNLGGANQLAYGTTPGVTGSGGTELIAPSSRLTDFDISTIAGIEGAYTVKVNIAYGDDDLLCSPSAPGSTCNNPATMNPAYFLNKDLLCKGSEGTAFCGTASLTTTVLQRLR